MKISLAKGDLSGWAAAILAFLVFHPVSSQSAAGARDPAFTTPTGTDGYPTVIRAAGDGKIIVGGTFQNYTGVGRKSVARLTAEGALDTTFDAGAGARLGAGVGSVLDLELHVDGKIVASGSFTEFSGSARAGIVRLTATGAVDSAFNPTVVGTVADMAIQSDGKILICGPTSMNGAAKPWKIFRLNTDGSSDGSFVGPTLGNSPSPIQIKALANGKILVSATYLTDTATVFQIIRLNSDGTLDGSFVLGKGGEGSPTGVTTRLEVAPDGKIVLAGIFTKYNTVTAPRLARLNEDGSVDSSFNMTGLTISSISDLAIQPDGKVLFCGAFSGSQLSFVRFNLNGAYDAAYLPELGKDAFAGAYKVIMQGDKPVVAGQLILFTPAFQLIPGVFRLTADTAGPPSITTAPAAQIVTEGGTAQFKVTPGGTGPFTFQWKKGTSNINNATNDTYSIDSVATGDAGNYSVVVSNASGDTPTTEASLTIVAVSPGKIFRDSLPIPGANAEVKCIVRAPDGKIVVSGNFNSFTGVTRNRVARLLPNGQVDTNFNTANGLGLTIAYTAAVQSDGKVVVGGNVGASYNNVDHFGLLRFLTTGALDTTFNSTGIGMDDTPFALAIQSDDKIITGGFAYKFNSVSLGHCFRLTPAGAVDTGFNPGGAGAGPGLGGYLYDLALRPDGKIFAVGMFLDYNGIARKGAFLLNTDGTLDNSFVPALPTSSAIRACALQSDGKLLVAGEFLIGNAPAIRVGVVRLNTNGSLDATFTPPEMPLIYQVFDVATQPDGKILVGGFFNTIGASTNKHLARLRSDGSIDSTFDVGAGPNGAVNTICVTPERTLFIGGEFTQVDGFARTNFARLNLGPDETTGPKLNFTIGNGTLTFDWPNTTHALQYTDSLPPDWKPIPDVPPFVANTSAGARFYRLIAR